MTTLTSRTLARRIACLCVFLLSALLGYGSGGTPESDIGRDVQGYLNRVFEEADIPGMSVVIIRDGKPALYHLGYADRERKKEVTAATRFELGSCSKAFTALGAYRLAEAGRLDLEAPVSTFIPWLRFSYKGAPVDVTVRQLLHHTSGISWRTIAAIPATDAENALEETVRTLVDVPLHHPPGKQYEYATINYDVVALVMQRITGKPFEQYVQAEILSPLRLTGTSVGRPRGNDDVAQGYKIGFFQPRRFDAPVYRGNNAAGYVVTDARDLARWLAHQMGLDSTALTPAIRKTHVRNASVAPVDNTSYAAGWFQSLNGDDLVFHAGMNPAFTAFVGFNPARRFGVAVLANSNSDYTEAIGFNLLRLLAGEPLSPETVVDNQSDGTYSTVSFILVLYVLGVIGFMGYVAYGVAKGYRAFGRPGAGKAAEALTAVVALAPFLYGFYKIPNAMAGFTWAPALVWTPISFLAMAALIPGAIAVTYLAYFFTLFFPEPDKHKAALPKLLLFSALSGLANMGLILLITSALQSGVELKFLVFYFGLTLAVYLMGRRYVQIKLIKLTRDLIYDLRVQLIEKIFSTSYQKFEKIDRGRIYTAFNDDVGTIGESTNMFIMLVTNLFTATAAMLYLASMAFWATVLTITLILSLCTIYYFVSRRTDHYFKEARDSRNVFMRLLNGMIDGFKEISLHVNKKVLYKQDIAGSANDYRVKISAASIEYVKASLIGETVLVAILGMAAFAFPVLFPGIQLQSISMFIIILLYLIGPVNSILSSVPALKRLSIAWNRVQQFLGEIPANARIDFVVTPKKAGGVRQLKVQNLAFSYNHNGDHRFDVGPINLEVNRGEILFIIGGNGSGKTTLAKLLTGLYEPMSGTICVDGKEMTPAELGEKYSAVFNPHHLFEKLYNIDVLEKSADIEAYLDMLRIRDKVRVLPDGNFSTINLSGGQRKRLALLTCYLEDSPIYLFDEWAADQDPEYRQFFYRTLLPEMRRRGKIVIAVTHDDHYFDVADKVMKMNQGKLEAYRLDEQECEELVQRA